MLLLEELGIDGSHISFVGAMVAALTWMWRKLTGMGDKIAAMELKIAEQYVTRPEFKALTDKMEKNNDILVNKIDNVTDNLLTLTNLMIKK